MTQMSKGRGGCSRAEIRSWQGPLRPGNLVQWKEASGTGSGRLLRDSRESCTLTGESGSDQKGN